MQQKMNEQLGSNDEERTIKWRNEYNKYVKQSVIQEA
jgi:hypothetical protein